MHIVLRQLLIAIFAIVIMVLVLYMSGCYMEHVAEPCEDGGELPDSSTVERLPVKQEDAGSSPALAADRCPGGVIVAYYGCTRPGDPYWSKYCEGPYANCIAPGSPWSSTWTGR
jgi:hypothetical protein